ISGTLASTTEAVRSTETKLAELEARLVSFASTSVSTIDSSGNTTSGTSTVQVTWSNDMGASIISFFGNLGSTIENGLARFVAVIADSITARTVVVNTLTVGSLDNLSASGITIYDRQTGAPTCMYVANGVIQSELGVCGATNTVSTNQGTVSEIVPENTSTPTVPTSPETVTEPVSESETIPESVPESTPTSSESVSEIVPETTVVSEPVVVETISETIPELMP
ncbi:MAG: hypothetical protein AAB484_03125, partial [Patescibacteria group bacterium]